MDQTHFDSLYAQYQVMKENISQVRELETLLATGQMHSVQLFPRNDSRPELLTPLYRPVSLFTSTEVVKLRPVTEELLADARAEYILTRDRFYHKLGEWRPAKPTK